MARRHHLDELSDDDCTMEQKASPTGSRARSLWRRDAAAAPYHGLLMFLSQILLVLLVPLFDHGDRSAPLQFTLAALAVALVNLVMLGYRRLPLAIGLIGAPAVFWAQWNPEITIETRIPAVMVLVAAYAASVYLSMHYAFTEEMRPSQRILCGAASFVMLGFMFTAAHGAIAASGLGVYRLSAELEGSRSLRWVDFVWLSFSTLTTAGFGDMTPIGSLPCAVAALEGLCGILYPATLIARIAAIPAKGEEGKCW